ncbi:hypothetical protein L1887_59481 [Cichorium endivia]|nr:hypothetical protein L1887_59481 [Cichorium endivia]
MEHLGALHLARAVGDLEIAQKQGAQRSRREMGTHDARCPSRDGNAEWWWWRKMTWGKKHRSRISSRASIVWVQRKREVQIVSVRACGLNAWTPRAARYCQRAHQSASLPPGKDERSACPVARASSEILDPSALRWLAQTDSEVEISIVHEGLDVHAALAESSRVTSGLTETVAEMLRCRAGVATVAPGWCLTECVAPTIEFAVTVAYLAGLCCSESGGSDGRGWNQSLGAASQRHEAAKSVQFMSEQRRASSGKCRRKCSSSRKFRRGVWKMLHAGAQVLANGSAIHPSSSPPTSFSPPSRACAVAVGAAVGAASADAVRHGRHQDPAAGERVAGRGQDAQGAGLSVDFHTKAWSEEELIQNIGQYHAIGIRSKTS